MKSTVKNFKTQRHRVKHNEKNTDLGHLYSGRKCISDENLHPFAVSNFLLTVFQRQMTACPLMCSNLFICLCLKVFTLPIRNHFLSNLVFATIVFINLSVRFASFCRNDSRFAIFLTNEKKIDQFLL